jgi:hypothetical protein
MRRIAAVVVLLLSSWAFADNHFAAIAYSPATGSSGTSWNYCNAGSAQQSAIGYCGQADCQSFLWVENQCGAVAVAKNGASGWALNGDRGLARANALTQCEGVGDGCVVLADVCT